MNIINYTQPTFYQSKYNNTPKINTSFKGHGGTELLELGKDALLLRHETSFFREYNTLNKSINYLRQHFPNERNPKIIVGACSTGEEALSIKMLMPDKKPQILGFDIGPNSIEEAKSGVYTISQPKDDTSKEYLAWRGFSAYKDEFLGFGNPKTRNQKILKNLFNNTFTQISEDSTPGKTNPVKKFINKLRFLFFKDINPEFNDKTFALKDPKNTGCKFIQGDIQHLDEIAPEGQAHAISFRNAIYHLLTTNNQSERIPKPVEEAEPILKQVAKQINKALTKNGIFILGEREDKQLTDTKLLSKVFKENGFKEVAKTKNGYCNIWAKIKDVN